VIGGDIASVVIKTVRNHQMLAGRGSEARLVPALTSALLAAGYMAAKYRIPGLVQIARHPDTGHLLEPKMRTIDIAVSLNGRPVAFIESEPDVNDAVDYGVARLRRGGDSNYAVDSIARRADGRPFRSYLSLERMAFAAFSNANPRLDNNGIVENLTRIRSDDPSVHNPETFSLYLVLERPDPKIEILDDRLNSLGCALVTP